MTTPRAFTLLEILAAIAVIGVLLALLLPALASARRTARFSSSLANHRTVLQTLAIYTHDHKDTHPYLGAADFAHMDRPPAPMGPHHGAPPRTQERHWMMALTRHSPDILPLLYPNRGHYELFKERDAAAALVSGCFFPTSTLFAAPDYFSPTIPPQWNHLRPTRAREIAYPSAKMMTFDESSVWLNTERDIEDLTRTRVTYGFADSSAAAMLETDLTGPSVERTTTLYSGPGFTTTGGLTGRDR